MRELAKLVIADPVTDPFIDAHAILKQMNYTMERFMFELMQPCGNMLRKCTWLGKSYPCKELFYTATSGEGFCCSFNYRPQVDSNIPYMINFVD